MSGRLLGSSTSVDRAHGWAHDHVRVSSGPLWVVDLSGVVAGALRAVQVTASGCWDLTVPLDGLVPAESCRPRRPGYLAEGRAPLALVPVDERAAGRPVDALTVPLNVSAFGQ
jgi:hypothetical protein